MIDLISRQAAIKTAHLPVIDDAGYEVVRVNDILALPSAQPECEDAVSRFEVLRLIDYSSNDLNDSVDNRYMQNEIKQLPSVTPKQSEWIPCSERCPAHRVYVLVTYKSVYGIPDIGITWYSKSEGKWNTSREVLAWMSLPKPFGDKT